MYFIMAAIPPVLISSNMGARSGSSRREAIFCIMAGSLIIAFMAAISCCTVGSCIRSSTAFISSGLDAASCIA